MWLYMLYQYNDTVDKNEESHWQKYTAVADGKLLITIELVYEAQQGSESGD